MAKGMIVAVKTDARDEIRETNEKIKKGGESTFRAFIRLIDAGGRLISFPIIVITAIINGAWAGILAAIEFAARNMREVDRDLAAK